jgi:hypothetical protein
MEAKVCDYCHEFFYRTENIRGQNWRWKRFCDDSCKSTFHGTVRHRKDGNELWQALDKGPIGPELEPTYEAARLAAREWNMKRLAALAVA